MFYKMSKINKKIPSIKIYIENDITSIWAILADDKFLKIHRRKRAKFVVKFR